MVLCIVLSVERPDPPVITNCESDRDIDFREEDFKALIDYEKYENGSLEYNWTFPIAVDSSNEEISPFYQSRFRNDTLFHPGITTVTIAFKDRYEHIVECRFKVIVRKLVGFAFKFVLMY